MRRPVWLAGVLLVAAPLPLAAQRAEGLTVSAFIGLSSNPVGESIESAMRGSGYGHDGIVVNQEYPWSSDYGEFPWMIRAAYGVRHPWQVALAFGDSPLGTTNGHRSTGGLSSENPSIEYGASFVAAEVRYPLSGWFSIGAGPALHRKRVACTTDCVGADGQSKTSFGAVADATLMARVFRRLHVGATAQYRLAGSMDAGPWTTEAGPIQRVEADFDHMLVAIGAAITF